MVERKGADSDPNHCQLQYIQGGVTLVASVLPSATAVKVEVKSQAYKSQQVKGQAVLVKVEKVNSQRARQIPQSILT